MIGQDITILTSDWLSRQLQLNTTFHHELKDPLSQMVFRNVFRSAPCISVSTLSTIILIYCSVSARSLGWTCRAWRARPWRGTSARWTSSLRGGPRRGGAACTRYCTVLYCQLYCTVLHQDQARENLNFFLGSMSGVIYYLNENGSCMEVPRL